MREDLGRKPQDADYGLGEHAIDGDRMGLVDEGELTERLMRTFASPDYSPPRLPAVAMELLSLSQNPDVEFSAVEKLLEQDAMLTGEILSIARSVHYSRGNPANTLRDALVRLGLQKLRQIVMQAAMTMRVFRSKAYAGVMERLRQHCQATAHLCRVVSRYTPMDEERAFLCGLLHDVGFAGILLVLGDVKRGEKTPDLAVLWPALDAAHARAGERMVEKWGLPPEVAMIVGAHHQVRIDGFAHPMAATVCVAELLASQLDLGFVPKNPDQGGIDTCGLVEHGRIDRSDDSVMNCACEALQLTEATLELIRGDAREWCEAEALA